jgi:hypothetical protein
MQRTTLIYANSRQEMRNRLPAASSHSKLDRVFICEIPYDRRDVLPDAHDAPLAHVAFLVPYAFLHDGRFAHAPPALPEQIRPKVRRLKSTFSFETPMHG